MKTITLPFQFGTIGQIIAKAKDLAQRKDANVETEFNGVDLVINVNTDSDLLWRDIQTAQLLGWKRVGPTSEHSYSEETLHMIEEAKQIREDKNKKEAANYAEKDRIQRKIYENKTKGVEMTFKNKEGWDKGLSNNTDEYGDAIYDYAEAWAKLMQAEIAKGNELEDIAAPTSFELGFMGITGFMYGAAVSILSDAWTYGDRLRKWHNKDYGQPEATGVVNPALLTVK